MVDHRQRALMATQRGAARVLKRLGLRDAVMAAVSDAIRRRRWREEARGSDRLSHPAAFEMDRALDEIIDRDGGYFVEAGANDGYTQSNTYWLERFRGWRGLLVEPMPELAAKARRNRPASTVVSCALVPAGEEGPVQMHFGDLMSNVAGTQDDGWADGGLGYGWYDPYDLEVPGRALSAVLDEVGAPEIDLLSLDVEGFELAVLQGLDFTRHAPRYVLVEIHDAAVNRPPIDAILGDRYRELRWLSPIDLLYVRTDVTPAP